MSFRLWIFTLVMVVAVTAIGATAWLTLSLTSREVSRTQEAQQAYQYTIVEELQEYGLRHGNWPGVDRLVARLSLETGLHIRVQTAEGDVLADSDTIANRPVGAVRGVALDVDPLPYLEDSIDKSEPTRLDDAITSSAMIKSVLFGDIFERAASDPAAPDLFTTARPTRMLKQLAQYRAALVAVRCMKRESGAEPALATPDAPYLSSEQMTEHPGCVREGVTKVSKDVRWLEDIAEYYRSCVTPSREKAGVSDGCVLAAFQYGAATTSADPLKLYLGSHSDGGVRDLGRPAILGAAGLIVVAALGTALIARRVSRPVRVLTDASRRLADGNLDVRVPTGGNSEISRLSASFNAMAEAVQQSEERQRRLIADVAHEMRTPLSNLRGYLEGLSDGVVEPSRDLFVSLHEETLLQRRILDDLQVLALAEAGDLGYTKSLTDLADLAATSAVAHRAVAAEAGVALTVDASRPVWVHADQDRLRQVLGNLLTNAIRYTDRDGQVLVRVRADGGEAVLTVQDTGVGITPGDVSRVFDRFWRADPARQRATGGTGLGLTIAHRIVTDHDGRIEVTSRPHVGTTFTVRLPLRSEPEA